MRITCSLRLAAFTVALVLPMAGLVAQSPAQNPSDRLRAVLPADVAERVLARMEAARARELPAQAIENRALKYASRGVAPADIERAINAHADRMGTASDLLAAARGRRPSAAEVDAGAEALRQGVDGNAVSALAKSTPSGRSLAVPLFVIGGLVERGLPSDSALARVRDRLQARATDADLEAMASGRVPAAGQMGLDRAAAARAGAGAGAGAGAAAGKAPVNIPQNAGKAGAPTTRPIPPVTVPPVKVPPVKRP